MPKITFWPNYLIWPKLVKLESYHEHISRVFGVSDNRYAPDRLYIKTWSSLCD